MTTEGGTAQATGEVHNTRHSLTITANVVESCLHRWRVVRRTSEKRPEKTTQGAEHTRMGRRDGYILRQPCSPEGIFKLASSLDSSLKKNTAFIKRLRTSLNADSQASLLKDIAGLSLEKYIPEVIAAASEGLQKCKTISDTFTATEVLVLNLHLIADHIRAASAFRDSIHSCFDSQYSACPGTGEPNAISCPLS